MDENKPDLFSEIFDKAERSASPPQRPRFEYPPEEEPDHLAPADSLPPLPPPPENEPQGKGRRPAGEKLLPWLCMMLGATLLVLGVCLLQLVRMNDRLDALEETVQGVALIDQLQRENKALQQEQEKLEQSVQQAQWRTRELEREQEDAYERYYAEQLQTRRLNYLWYLDRFMEAGDYPMAALVIVLSAEMDFGTRVINLQQVPANEAQILQYKAYKQELTDRGYLQLGYLSIISSTATVPAFPDEWNPSKNDDMAALGILWCALDAHFVKRADQAAAQYLYLSPLGNPAMDYQNRVERLASPFILEQFQLMKDELVASEDLTVAEDGTMTVGPGFHPDILYSLPFELPPDISLKIPLS